MMNQSGNENVSLNDSNIDLEEDKLIQIRERVLQAEKEKLHMDLPRGVINDIEEIIREEVD